MAIMAVLAITTLAQAETIQTPQGSYLVQQSSSTTYITQTSRGSSTSSSNAGATIAVPVVVNPVTGIGQVNGPNGSYLVQRSGSTTTVIQTSRGR